MTSRYKSTGSVNHSRSSLHSGPRSNSTTQSPASGNTGPPGQGTADSKLSLHGKSTSGKVATSVAQSNLQTSGSKQRLAYIRTTPRSNFSSRQTSQISLPGSILESEVDLDEDGDPDVDLEGSQNHDTGSQTVRQGTSSLSHGSPFKSRTTPTSPTSPTSPNHGSRALTREMDAKTAPVSPERDMTKSAYQPLTPPPIQSIPNSRGASRNDMGAFSQSIDSLSQSVDQGMTFSDSSDTRSDREVGGRVRAYVRIRPMTSGEQGEEIATRTHPDTSKVTLSDGKKESHFQFDRVFGQVSTNKEIFHLVCKPIVNAARNGFNGTLMAYGQTGTGKTFTLTSADGMTPRLINYLFHKISRDLSHDYKILCSYMQIYNEKIYDLLNSGPRRSFTSNGNRGSKPSLSVAVDQYLDVRESPEKGIFVDGLSEYIVRSPREVMELLQIGKSRLVISETKMNRASSRSHAICFLTVERSVKRDQGSKSGYNALPVGHDELTVADLTETLDPAMGSSVQEEEEDWQQLPLDDDVDDDDHSNSQGQGLQDSGESDVTNLLSSSQTDVVLRGRITICDLAGSERLKKTLASGSQLTEAQQINLSLLELGNVISALALSRTHVPFRNSILTRLLQESLGGNCKTRLIVCVAPCRKDLSETKSSLQFGYRAMRVTNNARVNVEIDYKALLESLSCKMREREDAWKVQEAALLQQIEQQALLKTDSALSRHLTSRTAQSKLWRDALILLDIAQQSAWFIKTMAETNTASKNLAEHCNALWNALIGRESMGIKHFAKTMRNLEAFMDLFSHLPTRPQPSQMDSVLQQARQNKATLQKLINATHLAMRHHLTQIALDDQQDYILLMLALRILPGLADRDVTGDAPVDLAEWSTQQWSNISNRDMLGNEGSQIRQIEADLFLDDMYHACNVFQSLYTCSELVDETIRWESAQQHQTASSKLKNEYDTLASEYKILQQENLELSRQIENRDKMTEGQRQPSAITQPNLPPKDRATMGVQASEAIEKANQTVQTELTAAQLGDLQSELLDRISARKAAFCRVGNKECCIM